MSSTSGTSGSNGSGGTNPTIKPTIKTVPVNGSSGKEQLPWYKKLLRKLDKDN